MKLTLTVSSKSTLLDKDRGVAYNPTVRKTYEFRIYPNQFQRRKLESQLEVCRTVYNKTLELRKEAWEKHKTHLSLFDTHKILGEWKNQFPELTHAHAQALQKAQERVDLAFKAFFRRVKAGQNPGYPRFKPAHRYVSMTYPQPPNDGGVHGNKVQIPKVGKVKISLHRPLEGEIKTVTVKRNRTGKWFVYFSVILEDSGLNSGDAATGIDFGVSSLATLSSSESFKSPREYKSQESTLSKYQRRMSKAEGPRKEKLRLVISHIWERIENRRSDLAFKLAKQIVDQYDIICIEDLEAGKLRETAEWKSLRKAISDTPIGSLKQKLIFKAEEAGKRVALVDPAYTTQRCSRCGVTAPKELSERTHNCKICGLVLGRDHNAAINILALGLQGLGIQSLESNGLTS